MQKRLARKKTVATTRPVWSEQFLQQESNDVTKAMQDVVDALARLQVLKPGLAPKADKEFYQRWLDEELADIRR